MSKHHAGPTQRRATATQWARSAAGAGALVLLAACTGSNTSLDHIEFGAAESLEHHTAVGTAPMFAALPDGRDVIAWVSAADSGINAQLYISVDGGAPAVLRDPLGPVEAHAESPPKIAVGADGSLHAIFVVGKEVPGRRFPLSALRYVRSLDGGNTWSAPNTLTDDGDFGSHNFHALGTGDSGRVVVAWLDGRHGPSSVYVAVSHDNGDSWKGNVRPDTTAACPCCRTAIALLPDGAILLAWRSILPGGIRDIVVARSEDDGVTWTAPVRVHDDNWEFNGCPHAGPSMQVDQAGNTHVAWWTGKEGAAGVWYARSSDGGKSFASAVPIDVADFARASHPQLAVSGDTVVTVWDDGKQSVPRVMLRRSTDGGRRFGTAQVLSDTAMSASYPVVTNTGRGLAVAWTALTAAAHASRDHHAPDMSDPDAVMKLTPVGDARVLVRREQRSP